MKVLIKVKALIILCLITVFAVTAVPGCNSTKVTVVGELTPELDELSLVEMWNIVANAADLQEQGAEFGSLYLHASPEGKIDSLYFTFQGWNKKGRPYAYIADMSGKGQINIRANEITMVQTTRHPSKVFGEIDKLGLSSLEPGDAGLALHIGFQYGAVGYSYDYNDLYYLEGGKLLPLKEIVFHSNVSWCTISVFKLYPVVTDNGSMVSSVTTAPGPVSPGERTSQMWFLSEDINKAEIVEYLESEQETKYDDFISGIQNVLPEGWEMELIAQEGVMGHPHGLNEPLFRIDFVDRTHQFEGPGVLARFPSLRLYFYDIQEKDAILETIEQEKIYSWDVPDYFNETAEYIVVTSPLYINGGCFSDEAMSLYTPLEKALNDYFNVMSG